MRRALGIFALIAALSASAAAQSSVGLSFLKLGPGARSMAMGETGAAASFGPSAMIYNPALLTFEQSASIELMHHQYVQDIAMQFLGAALPMDGWSAGMYLRLASVEGIELRTRPGEAEGTFASRDFVAGITVAVPFGDAIAIGATAKYIFEKIYVDVADGVAFDIGASVRPFDDGDLQSLGFGAAVTNLGSISALRSVETELPRMFRYGAAYRFPVESVDGDFACGADHFIPLAGGTSHVNVGLEFGYQRHAYLRVGYQTGFDNKSFSFGMGVAYEPLRIDYAFTPFANDFGTSHAFSISVTP